MEPTFLRLLIAAHKLQYTFMHFLLISQEDKPLHFLTFEVVWFYVFVIIDIGCGTRLVPLLGLPLVLST